MDIMTPSSVLLRAVLVAVVMTGAPSVRAEAPLMVIGRSGDAWETPFDTEVSAWSKCGLPQDGYAITEIDAARSRAFDRLRRVPFVVLGDDAVAELTDLDVIPTRSASASFFAREIHRLEAERALVFATRTGSWVGADQDTLDEMRAIAGGDRVRRFRPYLIRALTLPGPDGEFRVDVCAGAVRVTHLSDGTLDSSPMRDAVIVFLEKPPETVIVSWAVYDRRQVLRP